jgi:hypothetical protein
MYCKETILKIRNKYSQKRNCTASIPIQNSCVCERFIYSCDRSTYSAAGKYIMWTDPGNMYLNAHRHMNVENGTEAVQLIFWEYFSGIFGAVYCILHIYFTDQTTVFFSLNIQPNDLRGRRLEYWPVRLSNLAGGVGRRGMIFTIMKALKGVLYCLL